MIFFKRNGIFKKYYFVLIGVFSCFCQSATYAWLTPLLYYFKQPNSSISLTPVEVTCLTITMDVCNCVFSIPMSWLADVFGRKPLLWATGPITTVSWLVILSTDSRGMLFAMRALQGASMSISNSILSIYMSEISSIEVRGGIVSFVNTLWHLGMVYIYIVCIFFGFEGITWFTMAPNVLFTVLFYWCPESPYYYLLKNRTQDALDSLAQVREGSKNDESTVKELNQMEETVKQDKKLSKGLLKNILFSKKDRKSFCIVVGITVIYMMVGCNTIPLLASDTFTNLSGSVSFADYVTLLLGVVLLLMTVPAVILSDRWGRRPILLATSAGTFVLFLISSILLYLMQIELIETDYVSTVYYLCMVGGMCCNTFGVETIQGVLVSEMFPSNARSMSSGIMSVIMTAVSIISLSIYSYLESNVGVYANYVVFTVFSAIGFSLYYLILPETRGKSLGEIQEDLKK